MGETVSETRREIASIRSDISAVLDELERRGRRAANIRRQVSQHPLRTGLATAAIGLGVGWLAVRAARARRQPGPARERMGRLPWRLWRLRAEVEGRPVAVVATAEQEAGMFKRVLWAGMSAILVALATLLARRLSGVLWERMMGERPPAKVGSAT